MAERFDAGVRSGGIIANDMIAMPIGLEMGMAVVGSKDYFTKHPPPHTPDDLTSHSCINLRLPTYGGIYVWEFEKNGRELNIRVDGQLVFNMGALMVKATLAGLGLTYLPEGQVQTHLDSGGLVRVLAACRT